MKKIIRAVVNILDSINFYAGIIGSVFFIPLTLLMFYEVITRRILGSPTVWTFETSRFLFVPLIMLALGFTLIFRGHATIDLFYVKFSPKVQAILDTITLTVFLLAGSIIMFLNSLKQTSLSWASLERTASAFNAPIYPVKTLVPIGFALLFLAGISMLLKNIYFLVTKEKLESNIVKRYTNN
jgi:TRAP-type mannitol/chloroaromatic compound transport system permease small subunit